MRESSSNNSLSANHSVLFQGPPASLTREQLAQKLVQYGFMTQQATEAITEDECHFIRHSGVANIIIPHLPRATLEAAGVNVPINTVRDVTPEIFDRVNTYTKFEMLQNYRRQPEQNNSAPGRRSE